MSYLTSIVEDAWNAAVASPDYARWRSLACMADDLAKSLHSIDPDNIMVVAHRAVSNEARKRMLAMEPV